MTDFSEMSYEDAAGLVPEVNAEDKAFAEGDHWQGGNGWTGPTLSPNDPLSADVNSFIERIFVTNDVLNEIIDRHTSGVTGRAFVWSLSPSQGMDEQLVSDTQNLLQGWLDSRGVKAIMEEAVRNALWSTRGPLRLFVPLGVRDENGGIPREPFAQSLDRIFLEAPAPDICAVVQDPDTRKAGGIYLFQDGDQSAAEIVYTERDKKTVVRTTNDENSPLPLDFGGALTIFQMRCKGLITEPQKSRQKFLNHTATAAQASISVGGWPGNYFFNAMMPGEWVDDGAGGKKFVPDTFVRGPGTVNFLVGVSTQRSDGSNSVATPSYLREEPVNPDTFIKITDDIRRSMLNRAQQAHVLLTGMATANAAKIIETRAEYQSSLSTTKEQLDRALTWLLKTVIAMAATFSGESKYIGMGVVVDTQIDVGVVSYDEMVLISGLHKEGFISLKTALGWANVDDVDNEIRLLEAEKAEKAAAVTDATAVAP